MMRFWAISSLAVVAFGAAFLLGADAQEKQDVSGSWTGTWSRGTASGPVEMTLKQDGEAVSGTITSRKVNPPLLDAPIMGTFTGNKLSLKVPSTGGWIEATVDGKAMSGKTAGAARVIVDFTATRDK
jgi:hypothetical protein